MMEFKKRYRIENMTGTAGLSDAELTDKITEYCAEIFKRREALGQIQGGVTHDSDIIELGPIGMFEFTLRHRK